MVFLGTLLSFDWREILITATWPPCRRRNANPRAISMITSHGTTRPSQAGNGTRKTVRKDLRGDSKQWGRTEPSPSSGPPKYAAIPTLIIIPKCRHGNRRSGHGTEYGESTLHASLVDGNSISGQCTCQLRICRYICPL